MTDLRSLPRIQNTSHGSLREPRALIVLHIDESGSDAGSLGWLGNPDCRVSYNIIITDDGQVYIVAPLNRRAWHAGKCRPSGRTVHYGDINSAAYGVAAAAKSGDRLTPEQFTAIVNVCREIFALEGWPVTEAPRRITGHSQEAWPRGRKSDPEGKGPRPVYTADEVIEALVRTAS